jgi:hypothetical protein
MCPVLLIPSDTPDTEPLAPLAPETVTVELVTAEATVSQSDNPMVVLEFAIQAPGEFWDGRSLRTYLVNPETSKRTQITSKQIAKAFGADPSAFDPTDFIGKQCKVTLRKDVDTRPGSDGKEQRKIKDFVAA